MRNNKDLAATIDDIATEHFNKAAKAATRKIQKLLEKQFAEVRRHFDIKDVEEINGMTVMRFNGALRSYHITHCDDVGPRYEDDDPRHCSAEAAAALQCFMEAVDVAADFRLRYVLYDGLLR